MASEIENIWQSIQLWLHSNAPELASFFRAPAGDTKRVRRALRMLSFQLPHAYLAWIKNCADGQRMDGPALGRGIIPVPGAKTHRVFSLCDITLACLTWQGDCSDFSDTSRSVDADERVKPSFFDSKWFTFAADESNDNANRLALDMSDDTPGTIGQVISWTPRGRKRFVLCASFEELLQHVESELHSGSLFFDGHHIVATESSLFKQTWAHSPAISPNKHEPLECEKGIHEVIFIGEVVVVGLDGSELTDDGVLKRLDGEKSIESMTDFLQGQLSESICDAIRPEEGEVALRYDVDSRKLECTTRFAFDRPLKKTELDELKAYVLEQWSDGVGENFSSDVSAGYYVDLSRNDDCAMQTIPAD